MTAVFVSNTPSAGYLDAAVLDAARVGAGWAFERIHGVLAGPVLGYLRQQGVADPEGSTNEAFHRAFTRIAGFEGGADPFRRWVFTIAHNLIVDERRFASRRHEERAVERMPDVAGGNTETDALERLGGDGVTRLLDLVSDDQRDVLLLRFVADLTLEEVADATGRSLTAVKALQRRGLDALRRRLDPLGVSRRPAGNPRGPVSLEPDTTFTGV